MRRKREVMERLTERAEVDQCQGIWVKEGYVNEGSRTWFNGYDEGYSAISKCAEYEDLQEQGKLLILPIAVGDTVYTLNPLPSKKTVIAETTADAFFCALCALEERFGKTVFTNYEEAESALKAMSE